MADARMQLLLLLLFFSEKIPRSNELHRCYSSAINTYSSIINLSCTVSVWGYKRAREGGKYVQIKSPRLWFTDSVQL